MKKDNHKKRKYQLKILFKNSYGVERYIHVIQMIQKSSIKNQ